MPGLLAGNAPRREAAAVTVPQLRPGHEPACNGASEDFVVDDVISRALITAMTELAERYCARCPVLALCRGVADQRREVGLWAGALRYYSSAGIDGYRWWMLLPTAPQPGRGEPGRPRGRAPRTSA